MYKKIYLWLSMAVLAFSNPVSAQQFAPVGTAVAQFLEVGIGARGVGMGEAFTALTNDVNSVFWNPAGLANIQDKQLMLNYNRWPADISIGGMAFGMNFDRIGVFTLSTVYLATGKMDVTTVYDPEGSSGQTFNITNYALGLSYSRYMTERLAVGITLKLVSEKYWTYGYTTAAIDLGTCYHTGYHGLNIAMSILHFGPEVKFSGRYIDYSDPLSANLNKTKSFETYSLPINFRFGLSMDILEDSESHLVGAADMIHPNNNLEQYNLGLEYGYNRLFFLRGGYKFTADEGGLNLGLGFRYVLTEKISLDLDYAYSAMGVLTDIHRLGLGFAF